MIRLLVLAIVIAIFSLLAAVFPRITRVENVACTSQLGNCMERIIVADRLIGLSLKDAQTAVASELEKFDGVGVFRTRASPQGTLHIYLVERRPAVFIDGDYYDTNGKKVSGLDAQVPTVFTERKLTGEEIEFVASMMDGFFETYSVDSAQVVGDRLEVVLSGGRKFIVPLSGDTQILKGAIRLILSQLNTLSQETRIDEVDLRFANPVVR